MVLKESFELLSPSLTSGPTWVVNLPTHRENRSAFPKNGLIACKTLCQKRKVNVTKKQRILEKVEIFLPQQFSKRSVEEMWSRTVCNCVPRDYSPLPPGTARYGDLGKMDAPSSCLWQFLPPEGPLMPQPGERQPSKCPLEKTLLLQSYCHHNQ